MKNFLSACLFCVMSFSLLAQTPEEASQCELSLQIGADSYLSNITNPSWVEIYAGDDSYPFYTFYQVSWYGGSSEVIIPVTAGIPLRVVWHEPDPDNHNSYFSLYDPSLQRMIVSKYSGEILDDGQVATYTPDCGASCTEEDKCPLQITLTRTPNSSSYAYTAYVYVDNYNYTTLSIDPSESRLDTTLLFCPGRSVEVWTDWGGEDFTCTFTDAFGNVTESGNYGYYSTRDACAQQCELLLQIGADAYLSGITNPSWVEIYAGDDSYPFYTFYQVSWYGGSSEVIIPVTAGITLRVVWHEPDPNNHNSYFSLYDPSLQRMIVSKYSGEILDDGQVATYTPDCGASCTEEDKCPLQITLTRTPNSSSSAYSAYVYVDNYNYTTLSIDPSESRLDTTLLFCPGRSVEVWSDWGGEDFTCTFTDAFGNVMESGNYGYYSTRDVCAQQCELLLQIGAEAYLSGITNPSWLEIYAGDDQYPFYTFYQVSWYGGSSEVIIPVTAGIPLRVVWHEPDPDNHNSHFSLYDPSLQRMIFSKYSGEILDDGQVATYTPDCGASCREEDKCPLQITMTRTPNSSSYAYSAYVYVDNYNYTTLSIDPSESRLDTTLLFCPGRSVEVWSDWGGEDFTYTFTDAFGNVTESGNYGYYSTRDVCAQQCELLLQIGADAYLSGITNPSWLEIYAGDDQYPFYTFYQESWYFGSTEVTIPVTAGIPLRVVWYEPDPDNHNSYFSLYDPSSQRMIVSKYSGEILDDGQIATFTPDCGASCREEDKCPLRITLTQTPNVSNYGYSAYVYVDDYNVATLSIDPSESSLDTTLWFCPGSSVGVWNNSWGNGDFTCTITDAYGNVTEGEYYTRGVCAKQCKLMVEIGRQYPDWNAEDNTIWFEVYEGDDVIYTYFYSRGTAGTNTVIVPVTSNKPLRFIWHELDVQNHNSWCTIYSPSGDILFEKHQFEVIGDGEILRYTSNCDDEVSGGVVYVTPTGTGSGTSWEDAFSSIKIATIKALNTNADVWVAAGTYYGDVNSYSENAFMMLEGVNVYGGFAGNESVDFDLSQRDLVTNKTILDGQNERQVLYSNHFNTPTLWDGFIIQHGNGYSGGGAALFTNTQLNHCSIINNYSSSGGGGIYAVDASVSNCLIANNSANWGGGLVLFSHSSISNSTVVHNRSYSSCISGEVGSSIINCIIWGNKTSEGDLSGISGSVTCSYSAIEGDYTGDGIVTLSAENPPLFVNPSLTIGSDDTTFNVDWHLQQGSPCINVGDNNAVIDSIDLAGTARIKRDTVDLGCYESDYYSPVPVETGVDTGLVEVTVGPLFKFCEINGTESIHSMEANQGESSMFEMYLYDNSTSPAEPYDKVFIDFQIYKNGVPMSDDELADVMDNYVNNSKMLYDFDLSVGAPNISYMTMQNAVSEANGFIPNISDFGWTFYSYDWFYMHFFLGTENADHSHNGRKITVNTGIWKPGSSGVYTFSFALIKAGPYTAEAGQLYKGSLKVGGYNGHVGLTVKDTLVADFFTIYVGDSMGGGSDTNVVADATLPSVTTGAVSNILATTATCGGSVTDDGGATVTARGVCWSTSQNPTVADSHTNDSTGIGVFASNLTNLIPNTTYYVRAYAMNSEGTAYGDEVVFTTLPDYSGIIYVTQTGAGTHSGDSWTNATSSIGEAQALAQTYNAVVWVAAGTYYGDTSSTSENAFTMVDGVNVYGGFAGNELADYDLTLRDFEANATILDGMNARRVLWQPDNFGTQTIWDGFTIQNGWTSDDGGGASIRGNSIVRHCVFKNNTAQTSGGGLYAHVVEGQQGRVESSVFEKNTAGIDGGGISSFLYSYYVAPTLTITNCLIANNSAVRYGGGVIRSNQGNCNFNITNTTIVRNTSGDSGGGVYGGSSYGRMTLTNCVVWGNQRNGVEDNLNGVSCTYSAVEGGYPGEGNVLLADHEPFLPLFANPSLTAGASDNTFNVDWHLMEGSICINHGNNEAVTDSSDLDGTVRIKRDTVDLGCYESDYYSSEPLNYAGIIYVTVTGAGSRTGDSWDNAVSSISLAQKLADIWDAQVWVAAGTYYGDTTSTSENAFTMVDGVNVYGGFAGNEPADYDLTLRDFETNVTILDGMNARRVLYQSDNFGTQTIWDGFTVQHGWTSGDGGGACIRGNSILGHFVYKNNTAQASGGGLYAYVSDGQHSRVEFSVFENNTADFDGGGIGASLQYYWVVSKLTVSNCLIANNMASGFGGGIIRQGSGNCDVFNTTIVRNTSGYNGGGAYGGSSYGRMTLTNCIVWGNQNNGVENNLNEVSCTYSAVEGGFDGEGNINLDSQNSGSSISPFFVAPTDVAGTSIVSGDWHLLSQSICINMGSLDSTILSEIDLDGQPRIQQGRVDIGCYESQSSPVGMPVEVTVTSNNSAYGICSGSGIYPYGATVTLHAIPSSNAHFLRWNDNDTSNPRYVIVESDTSFEAIFELYLPELHVTSISHSDFIGGETATISWTVQNDGTASTPNGEVWYDRVWLSVESRVAADNNPILLGEFNNVSALAPGEYYTQTQTFDIPVTLSGTYYLFVITDAYDAHQIYWDGEVEIPYNPPAYIGALTAHGPGSRIEEMSEFYNPSSWHDNFFYDLVNIAIPPLPDLQVASVFPRSAVFYSGTAVDVTYRVINRGDYDTRIDNWRDVIFVSNSDVFDGTARVLNSINHQGLLVPDSLYQVTVSVTVPLEMYGTAYFYVYTDYYDQVYEHVDNTNNVSRSDSVNIILSPPANLVPQNINADPTVSTGALFNFSYEIYNQGAGDPNHSSWIDRCYLSTSSTELVDEMCIATDYHYGGLTTLNSYSIQHSASLPSSITSGTYYLFVHADAQNDVFEYVDDDDNLVCFSQPIIVVQPDLQIQSLNVASSLSAGAEASLSYMLSNTGEGAVINCYVTDGFYLSQSPEGTDAIQLLQFTTNTWLNAHDSTMRYQNVMLPGDLQDGYYYLFVLTNVDNSVNEANTNNNRSPIRQVYINHQPLPDLVITSVSIPDSVTAGFPFTLTANLTNQGETTVSLDNLTLRLSVEASNDNISCSIEEITTEMQSLAVGAVTTVSCTAVIPPSVSTNPASFNLMANSNHTITESNYSNNGFAFNHAVQAYPFDLAVTEFMTPDQIISGEYINVEWTVWNRGTAPSNSWWYDRIYLSADSMYGSDDIQIGSYTQNQTLYGEGSYTAHLNCRIPVAAGGDYYVLVVCDVTQMTFDSQRANNVAAHPIAVTQSALPDLQMDTLIVLNTLTSGETYTLRYNVSNIGEHVTHDNRWTDAFYLNHQPNLNGAVQLGSKIHNGQLDINAHYFDSINVTIPNYWIGELYLMGFTDATGQIVEMGNNSNNIKITPVSVAQPLPCDLSVLQPDFPRSAVAGDDITVAWTVRNIGLNTAQGTIKDAVYLSIDSVWSSDDIMLGSVQYAVNIPANGQQQQSATLPLQGVPVGNYYIVVKTNILNALNENSYTNNKVVSLTTINVDYPSLYIDQEEQRQLAQNQTVYYKLQIGPEYEHQTLSCKLTANSQNVANSLYIAFASAPSATHFDWSATMPYVQEQEILIPSLEQGTYYIMANGQTSNNSSQSVTLLASIIHFEIISVNTDRGTNAGSVTTQILGAKFDTIMDFRLANSNGYLPAEKIFFHNSTETYATFNLRDQETGVYDMVAELPGGIITVKGQAFVVESGLPAELLSNIIAPASVRQGNTFTVTIEYGNNGSTDLNISGFLLVSTNGFPIAFESDSLANNATELTFETAEPNGNPDVIRPGHYATKTIFVRANRVGNINLKLYPIRRQY